MEQFSVWFFAIAVTLWGSSTAAATTGNLFATVGAIEVRQYSSTGVDLGTFAKTGLQNPSGIKFDGSGNLYLADFTLNIISKFSPTGADLGIFANTGLSNPENIAFDKNGNLYAANVSSHSVRKYSPTGTDLGTFGSFGNIDSPHDLAFDNDGNSYVVGLGTIAKFSPTGVKLGDTLFTGAQTDSIAIGPNGNLYVADYLGPIYEFSTSLARLGTFAVNPRFDRGLAFDSDGNLYVAKLDDQAVSGDIPGDIHKYGPGGEDLGIFAHSAGSTIWLAFAPSPVPEPGTILLAVIGSVLLAGRCGRGQK